MSSFIPEQDPLPDTADAEVAAAFEDALRNGDSQSVPDTDAIRINTLKLLNAAFSSVQAQTKGTPLPAEQIGRFKLIRRLGVGGLGEVFLATDPVLRREVAIKIPRSNVLANDSTRQRLLREREAAASLQHPNIVSVFESGEHQGVLFIVSEFCDGPNLSEWISDRGSPADPITAARITLQLADAVAHSHSRDILHRDIKPANVLLQSSAELVAGLPFVPRLTDFGVARLGDDSELTETGDILGTAAYMAPEQALGDTSEVGHRSDVYSLGALLYFCITGHRPFQSGTPVEVLRRVVEEPPVAPRQINPNVDADLETICLRCLEKKPSQRFASAEHLAEELQRYLNREPILSRPVSVAERCFRWCQRRPYVASSFLLLSLLVLLLSIGIPLAVIQQSRREQAEVLAESSQKLANEQRKSSEANAARAATHQYFATMSDLGQVRLLNEPGWSWKTVAGIHEASALEADGKQPEQLRSQLASALTSIDLNLIDTFAGGIDPSCAAWSPDGRRLALGEVRPAPGATDAAVHVFEVVYSDSADPVIRPWRVFRIPSVGPLQKLLNQVSTGPEGIRSLCFSNDGTRLAAGTRYGQLLEWSVAAPDHPVRVVVPPGKGEQDRIIQLAYLPGDTQFVGLLPSVVRVWDQVTGKQTWASSGTPQGFTATPDASLFVQTKNSDLIRVANLASSEPIQQRTFPGHYDGIVAARSGDLLGGTIWRSTGLVPYLLDRHSLDRTLPLQPGSFQENAECHGLKLGPDDAVAIAAVGASTLRCWDTLSRTIPAELTVNHASTRVCEFSTGTGLLSVSSNTQAQLYRLRTPSVFAPGAWPIGAFHLSSDGKKIAILERLTKLGVRVRTFELRSTAKPTRWLECGRWCIHTRIRSNSGSKSDGNDLAFDQAGNVILTSKSLGFQVLLIDAGFQIPDGLARPIAQATPQITDTGVGVYNFPPMKDLGSRYDAMVPAITFRIAKPFLNDKYVLDFRIENEDGGGTHRALTLRRFEDFGNSQWQTVKISEEKQKPVRVTVCVRSKFPRGTILADPPVEFGLGFVVAAQATESPWYWVGPVGDPQDGTVWAIDSGDHLLKWNDIASTPDWKWSDTLNENTSLRDLATTKDSAIVGTRRGHVFQLMSASKSVRQISTGPRVTHGGETPDEITCVAVDRDGSFSVSGNKKGELTVFDLRRSDDCQRQRFEAHHRQVSDVAITSSGGMLVSAGEDKTLKFWNNENGRLKLYFQLDQLANPAVDMQFSSDDSKLYVLCRGERGIRIFDLKLLQHEFGKLQLDPLDP